MRFSANSVWANSYSQCTFASASSIKADFLATASHIGGNESY
jgi:hypothetical protein